MSIMSEATSSGRLGKVCAAAALKTRWIYYIFSLLRLSQIATVEESIRRTLMTPRPLPACKPRPNRISPIYREKPKANARVHAGHLTESVLSNPFDCSHSLMEYGLFAVVRRHRSSHP